MDCKRKEMIVHIRSLNLNLLHFHVTLYFELLCVCYIQIKDHLVQNLYNCTATLLSSLLESLSSSCTCDLWYLWELKIHRWQYWFYFHHETYWWVFVFFHLYISFHTVEWRLDWNRGATERLREGQEPWPSRHGLNRGRVYFFLTSIRHPTVPRLWNGIYVLRLFVRSSSVSFVFFFFFFFWCYYRSGLFLLTQLFSYSPF